VGLLEGQKVLLISPQPWDHIHLSKHHYAIELARRGNEVFFLGPPDDAADAGIRVESVPGVPLVRVIRYRLAIPAAVRIHMRPMFDLLLRRTVAKIREATGSIDVVWCFDFNLFADLGVFGAPLNLFHPVDRLSQPAHVEVGRSADAIFSVSDRILSSFTHVDVPRFFINHGLSEPFARLASQAAESSARKSGPPRIGYAGNLTRPPLNRVILSRMVAETSNAEFHFWGPYEMPEGGAMEAATESREFVRFLREAPNVVLHGPVASDVLAAEIQEMDCFVLSYSLHSTESDRSNSHKILEYLSTGKVIVSSRISTYAEREDLLRMPAGDDDAELPGLLLDTISRLDEWNATSMRNARKAFALDNTYSKQVDRIRQALQSLP
jgi:glycosyltransferase involved in cell wall biosynthesis